MDRSRMNCDHSFHGLYIRLSVYSYLIKQGSRFVTIKDKCIVQHFSRPGGKIDHGTTSRSHFVAYNIGRPYGNLG